MRNAKTMMASLALVSMMAAPALAASTNTTYTSGILVLGFVALCALLVVVQLLPALKALFGITKDAAKKSSSNYSEVTSGKK